MNNKFIQPFIRISKGDVNLAGGKGASLGEMTQSKIPVPSGFVILSTSFDKFLQETDLKQDIDAQLKKINFKDTNSVDRYANVIRDMIAKSDFPTDLKVEVIKEFKKLKSKYVAVRSSATAEDSKTASWAGELDTFLNTTEKSLIKNIKNCWASLFTPRAIFYRHEKKLIKSRVSVAVVIQTMIQSEISGIVFTVHPVTKDKNQMIIESGFGLGEAIVSGQITPDSYVVDKRDNSILDINISVQEKKLVQASASGNNKWVKVANKDQEKQKLTGKQIIQLTEICRRIENHYKFPCDIEWAYAKNKFYITQSRPITTLD